MKELVLDKSNFIIILNNIIILLIILLGSYIFTEYTKSINNTNIKSATITDTWSSDTLDWNSGW